jgi:hypothetical protein
LRDWSARFLLVDPAASDDPARSIPRIAPEKVRYIKLGERGRYEAECETSSTVRIGYGTAGIERFALCAAGDWAGVRESFITEGKAKGTAKGIARQLRDFFEDSGSTLWITFIGERLCWGFTDGSTPDRNSPIGGVIRPILGGWCDHDLVGEPLVKDRLSGALTKVVGYRGTVCETKVPDYVVRRINGDKAPEIERAIAARADLQRSILPLIRQLGPKDFELLVELIFSSSGWRRLSPVGGTQKTKDFSIQLPSTGEHAFVQVKSKTTNAELATYAAELDERGPFDRMFFVYHSGAADLSIDDDRVVVIGPEKLAKMVLDAGLDGWIIDKVS